MSESPLHIRAASPIPIPAASPIPIPAPKFPTTTPEPSFICTICWQPQFPPSRPKLLGTSARIVCRACWRAVLDLSICWVCGECIVRGDEVVSLGWCFWHSGCFGCLVCGGRMDVPSDSEGEGEEEQKGHASGRRGYGDSGMGVKRRRLGVELSEIPLCRVCEIETAGESQGQVLEKGLQTTDRFDGGLSRDRLQMLSDEGMIKMSKRRKLQPWRRVLGVQSEQNPADRDPGESQSSLLLNAADITTSEDGTEDDVSCHDDMELAELGPVEPETSPEIYVSIFDPVREPAFESSQTKPLPRWMQLLPNNVHRRREKRRRRFDGHAESSHAHELRVLGSTCSDVYHDCDLSFLDSMEEASEDTTSRYSASRTSTSSPIPKQPKHRATISFDTRVKKDRKSEGLILRRRSQSTGSADITPSTCLPTALPVPPGQRTPFPRLSRPDLERNSSSSYFSRSINIRDAQGSSYGAQETASSFETSSPIAPSDGPSSAQTLREHSAGPVSTTNLSATKIEKSITNEPEQILQKIKRQKIAQAAEDKKSLEPQKIEDEVDRKREELNKELRHLFRKE